MTGTNRHFTGDVATANLVIVIGSPAPHEADHDHDQDHDDCRSSDLLCRRSCLGRTLRRMKRLCSLWAAIIGIGIGVAIAIGFSD